MKQVIIVGAGGHAAELQDYIEYINQRDESIHIQIAGYIDDDKGSYDRYVYEAPYLGTIKSHSVKNDHCYLMAIASVNYRKPITEKLKALGAQFISLIHPTATISKSATIGQGVVIAPNVNVGPNVQIGDFNIINSRASVAHDTHMGSFNVISPNVCFSGASIIGDQNMFGINSATIPGIEVGSNNTIAAGMIIDKNVKNDATVFHRFKEKIIFVKGK